MPPDISKLIAAIIQLVENLNEKSGLPANDILSNNRDPRFNSDKTRVQTSFGLPIKLADIQENDRTWNKIAKIFAKNYAESITRPDYEEESPQVPAIIQQAAVDKKTAIEQEGFFSKLMSILLPIALVVAGIATGIAALFTGPGPLGSTLNIISKLIINIGSKVITKIGEKLSKVGDTLVKLVTTIADDGAKFLTGGVGGVTKTLGGIASKVGSVIAKIAKRLPFIGSAISFYLAYQRFQQGDYVGASLEIASGLVNLIPVYGWIGSILIDLVTIGRDLSTTQEERVSQGGMGIVKMLMRVALNIGGKLLKVLKFVPFIGSAVSFYFAYKRFQEGDYIGMGLEIISGIADLIPGAGTAVSWIIDIINLVRDVSTTKEERAQQSGGLKKLFLGIGDWFKQNGLKVIKNVPFIGSLVYLYEAYNAGFNTPEGIKKVITSFASIFGLGGIIEPAIEILFSIFTEDTTKESGLKKLTVKPFFQIAKEYAISQLKRLPAWLRKPLEWLGFGKITEVGEMRGEAESGETSFDFKTGEAKTKNEALPGNTSPLPRSAMPSSSSEHEDFHELMKYLKDQQPSAPSVQGDASASGTSGSESIKIIQPALTVNQPIISSPPSNISLSISNEPLMDPMNTRIYDEGRRTNQLLSIIADKIGIPSQQIPGPAAASIPTGPSIFGSTGGVFSGKAQMHLFPTSNYSELA